MTQPAELTTAPVPVEAPRLAVAPLPITSQRHFVADGWVLIVPFAGAATGTAIREFGLFGLAASVAGGLLIAVGATLSPLPVTQAMRRSAQFSARARLALPRGSDA